MLIYDLKCTSTKTNNIKMYNIQYVWYVKNFRKL